MELNYSKLSPKQKDVLAYVNEKGRVYPNSAIPNRHAAPLSNRSRIGTLNIGVTIEALEKRGWLKPVEYGYEFTSEGLAAYLAFGIK